MMMDYFTEQQKETQGKAKQNEYYTIVSSLSFLFA